MAVWEEGKVCAIQVLGDMLGRGAVLLCRRAARLGVSPDANCSWREPSPISPTTSPVWIPRRTARHIAKRAAHGGAQVHRSARTGAVKKSRTSRGNARTRYRPEEVFNPA